jgi:hypothetical protein
MWFEGDAMKAMGLAAALLAASAGAAGAMDLPGWTQPLSGNPLCHLKVERVYQTSSGQTIHVVVSNTGQNALRFDLDVILRNGRTGETRQIRSADLKPREVNADFQTNAGYSTTGRSVSLRLDACALN